MKGWRDIWTWAGIDCWPVHVEYAWARISRAVMLVLLHINKKTNETRCQRSKPHTSPGIIPVIVLRMCKWEIEVSRRIKWHPCWDYRMKFVLTGTLCYWMSRKRGLQTPIIQRELMDWKWTDFPRMNIYQTDRKSIPFSLPNFADPFPTSDTSFLPMRLLLPAWGGRGCEIPVVPSWTGVC